MIFRLYCCKHSSGGAEVYHRSNEIQCAIDIKNCRYKYRIIHISTEIILQKKNLTS